MNTSCCNSNTGKIIEALYSGYTPENENNFINPNGSDSLIIKSYTLINNNVEIVIITWGATIVSIKYPDKYGRVVDVVLGFDNLDDYMNSEANLFIGCVLGRCANRIKDGILRIKGRDYQLSLNDENDHLHGGIGGFGRRNWDSHINENNLILTYLSPDGEDGYPGTVLTILTFKLTAENTLDIKMQATTTRPTLINLSYGLLFNLAGHNAGEDELKMHSVSLNCDRCIFTTNEDGIPINKSRRIGGTLLDFRVQRLLGNEKSCMLFEDNFEQNLCVIRDCEPALTFVCRAYHGETGRVLEVFSNQPGLQLDMCGRFPSENDAEDVAYGTLDAQKFDELASYSSFLSANGEEYIKGEEDEDSYENTNFLFPKSRMNFIPGKKGAKYMKFCAFGVYPQNYHNSAIKHIPSAVVRPGQVYHHHLVYKFGVQLENSL
ncbi:galactose mutarotase-like [Diachasmimorpha longicaudata]|uniref:galactose mutarotase-like n=1 Tax=Diachasmimorpha longicaudata TaxID=58733 RepID=UPI0030B8E620